MKNSIKINRFYLLLVCVLIVLSLLVIITLRTIFAGIITALEVEEDSASVLPFIDKNKLIESQKLIFERQIDPLDIGENSVNNK